MSQKQVAGWLKGITLSIAGMGLLFFGLVVPYLAWDMAVTYPDYAALRIPGILYGWGIAVFCYAILYQFWKVCVQIGRDNSFSGENARSFVVISRLAFVLAVVWFAGILFLAAKRALGPAFLIFMILLIFINVVIAVLAAALSHLIYNGINMDHIESRPLPERNWEYRFFVDFEGNLNDPAVQNALRGLSEETTRLQILGNYEA